VFTIKNAMIAKRLKVEKDKIGATLHKVVHKRINLSYFKLCEIPAQEMKENDKNNITNYLINTITNYYITHNSKNNQVFL